MTFLGDFMFYELNHIGSSDFFKKEYRQNYSYPMHLHQCYEIVLALSGEITVTVDKIDYKLSAGEALFVFPNQIHSLETVKSEIMVCIFSHKLIAAYHTKFAQKKPVSNKFKPSKELVQVLNNASVNDSSFKHKGILYLLCDEFNSVADYCERNNDSKDLLARIFYFIEESFTADCSLDALSKKLGYDYSYLSRFFKKNVGIAFNEYVNICRLNNACYLLNNTDDTILKCAVESGFDSLRSFNRNFKEQFGISPTEYLKANKRHYKS